MVLRPTKSRGYRSAQMIDSLSTLHVRRFGFRFITYLQTYTMFVSCTIDVLDLKENESENRLGVHQAGVKEKCLALAQEASVRLNFGLEVLRQTGATPSAARCAAVIVQLLRQWSDKKAMSVSNQRQYSGQGSVVSSHTRRQSSSLSISPGVGLFKSAPVSRQLNEGCRPNAQPRTQVLPLSTAADANHDFQYAEDLSSPRQLQTHAYSSTRVSDGMALQYYSSMTLQPDGPSGGFYLHSNSNDYVNIGIETPMRWLPENIQDDGSWMLMTDFEHDFLGL